MSQVVRSARGPLRGTLRVPGDKSIAHRALILGTLAKGHFHLRNMPSGKDVISTRLCLEALGARIREKGECVDVDGLGLEGLRAPAGELDCGNSGTTMRLLAGVLAGQPFESVLTGDESLSRRPMLRVAEPLERMGAKLSLGEGGRPPLRVKGRRPLKSIRWKMTVPSAQVKSAVLLAGLFAEGKTTVQDPFGTRDHTERMLDFLGKGGPALRSGKSLTLPGDISTASFYAAAAATIPGSEITIKRVALNPTRMGFFEALKAMGAQVEIFQGGINGGEPVGDIAVAYAPLRGAKIAAEKIPSLIDEVPLLAVVACVAEGETRIDGLAELRLKESDRLAGTAAGLKALGADVSVDKDSLTIHGPCLLKGAGVDALGDHRLAMTFAVAGLAASGETEIVGGESVEVSHPAFFDDLERLRRGKS